MTKKLPKKPKGKAGRPAERLVIPDPQAALNDYAATVPIDDFAKFNVILAMKRDGQYMPVRDKGPLFVIYPYDSSPELKSQVYYARSVWQVKSLEVLD